MKHKKSKISEFSPLTPSEKLVLEICEKSCLSFWCYNNPKLPSGNELCDVLVVFEEHIIILSVKEIALKRIEDYSSFEDPTVALNRWNRKAVEKSVDQIYGAERSLVKMECVLRSDGSTGAKLPPMSSRNIHRIAVAFGSRGETKIVSKDYGKGYVHVMNEESFETVLNELDTISELTDYLTAKEDISARTSILLSGNEANLLAVYLFNGRKLPFETEILVVEDDSWEKLQKDPLFLNRKFSDKESYEWDRLILFMSAAESTDPIGSPLLLSDKGLALKVMAKESRVNRRALQNALTDFLKAAVNKQSDARIARLPQAPCIYVFRFYHFDETSEAKIAELQMRCAAASNQVGDAVEAVGIGFAEDKANGGYEITLAYIDLSTLSDSDKEEIEKVATEGGIGRNVQVSHRTVFEYPDT